MQFYLFLRWLIIFSCIFSARAQETGPQEEHVVAGIDPVMEIRIGKLYRDQALKNYPVSKNQAYTDIVNRVGNRIANSIGERPDRFGFVRRSFMRSRLRSKRLTNCAVYGDR